MKKQTTKIKKKIYKILIIILTLATVYSFAAPKFINPDTAFALGDLTIDWGVPVPGDPIFVVENMLPGDVEQRSVIVKNNGTSTKPIHIIGERTGGSGNIESVLDMVISENSTDLYGGTTGAKTVEDFFTNSPPPDGLFLFDLGPGVTKTINFKVTFDPNAGNEFQLTSVIFDLTIRMVSDIPAECQNITFEGDPIFGTALGDVLVGTNGNDLIFGLEGGDSIDGLEGDDCLVGGLGGDSIFGREGKDVLLGNEDGDSLDGGEGDDLLIGHGGDDYLIGGAGIDQLFGNEGHDTLDGGDDNDFLDAAEGDDTLLGGGGNDQMFAGPGSDTLGGGSGNDLMRGNEGVDVLQGDNGEDEMYGDEDLDSLGGGNQNDYLDGGAGGAGNVVNGQNGTDTCLNGTFINCEL